MSTGTPRALTGHANGVISINVAEADDAQREKQRLALHEPYRTMLGHFRHESGHYYWGRLVSGTGHLQPPARPRAGSIARLTAGIR